MKDRYTKDEVLDTCKKHEQGLARIILMARAMDEKFKTTDEPVKRLYIQENFQYFTPMYDGKKQVCLWFDEYMKYHCAEAE